MNGNGVAKDDIEAVKWFRKAAEQNFADAQYDLGICYFTGNSVTKDTKEAVKLFGKAAEQDLTDAQFALGVCNAKGEGVAKDNVEAYKWLSLAAIKGSEKAKQFLAGLKYGMSPEEITEAKRLAYNFKPRKEPEAVEDAWLH